MLVVPAVPAAEEPIGASAERCAWLLTRTAQILIGSKAGVPPRLWCLTSGVRDGRGAQSIAHALLTPQVLGIFGAVYGGEAKARAINAYGVTVGVAAVFGQLIGGLLIQANLFGLGWRTCFLINVPVGAVALVLTLRRVPETRAPRRPGLDPVGMALISLALVAVVLPMIEGREQGWPLWGWVCLAAAVPLFAAFGVYEERLRRGGGSPLLDLRLFRERAFSAGLTALIVFYGGMASYFLVLALYLQFGRGLDALGAGLVFIAVGTGYLGASLAARHIAARLGRQAIAVGGLLRILGLAVLIATVARIGVSGSALWLVPGLIIDGAGLGLAVAPLTSTVLARMTPQHAGAASGVLATGLQVGNALGVAVIGVVFYGLLPPGAETVAGRNAGYGHAFGWSLVYLTGVAVALIVLVQVLPRGVERGSAVGGR